MRLGHNLEADLFLEEIEAQAALNAFTTKGAKI